MTKISEPDVLCPGAIVPPSKRCELEELLAIVAEESRPEALRTPKSNSVTWQDSLVARQRTETPTRRYSSPLLNDSYVLAPAGRALVVRETPVTRMATLPTVSSSPTWPGARGVGNAKPLTGVVENCGSPAD